MVFTSHFLAHGLAQQAGRLDQQHEDQHGEHQRVAQLGGDIRFAENLDHTSSTPPIIAPGMEPIPPKTAAVNALMPGMEPVVGWSVG